MEASNLPSILTQQVNSGLFWGKQVFTITPEYIVYQKGDQKPLTWQNGDILDVKFGKYPINYNSPGGRGERYSITFLNTSGATMNLQYYNFLHLKPKYAAFYNEVIARIKEYFIKPFVADKYNCVIRGEVVEIGRLRINRSEISVVGTGLSFTWKDLSVR